MGVWQMAPQKLGWPCHTHMSAPATTKTATTTPTTIGHFLLGRFDDGFLIGSSLMVDPLQCCFEFELWGCARSKRNRRYYTRAHAREGIAEEG